MLGKREYFREQDKETMILLRPDDTSVFVTIYYDKDEVIGGRFELLVGDNVVAAIPISTDEVFSIQTLYGGLAMKPSAPMAGMLKIPYESITPIQLN